MPVFRPRSRLEILRDMVARVVARSRLVGLTRNGAVFHVIAASSTEDAEQYFQMARLRDLFSIDKATGSDLDARAAEIQPGTITRAGAIPASGDEVFSRPGTVGTVVIPLGTLVSASDAKGRIQYRTTVASSILAGNTVSAAVNVVALEAGIRGNVSSGSISQFVTRIPGVTGATNGSDFDNGRDRESDDNFRARLKAFVQSLSRGTVTALEGFARNVRLTDGRRVLFANVVEPAIPNGNVDLFIDDGTGSAEEFSNDFITADDTIIASAVGGESTFFTFQKPIKDDGTFVLEINAVPQTRGVGFDFTLDPTSGKIILDPVTYPTGLTALDAVTANYRFFIGLIQQTQKVIDGDPGDPLRFPGVRAGGIRVTVGTPLAIFQTISGNVSVLNGFDPAVVALQVGDAVQDYINSLDIGENVIVAEIIQRAMDVPGMFDLTILNLTGTSPALNQVILETQIARIVSASITFI